ERVPFVMWNLGNDRFKVIPGHFSVAAVRSLRCRADSQLKVLKVRINDVVLRSVVADGRQKLGNDDIRGCRHLRVGKWIGLHEVDTALGIPHSKAGRYTLDRPTHYCERRYGFVSISSATLKLITREPSIRMPVCEPRAIRYVAQRVHF